MTSFHRMIFVPLILAFLLSISSSAETKPKSKKAAPAPAQGGQDAAPTFRKKNIQFDDGLIEGLGQRPRDSLSQIGEQDRASGGHLYNKEAYIKESLSELHRELELVP